MAVPFGVSGATVKDIGISSGREMFRCGTVVKVYITNVSAEIGTTVISCNSALMTEGETDGYCVQSVQGSQKGQATVNWEGKTGANSGLGSGAVITCAKKCGEGATYVPTHTEGQAQVSVLCSPEQLENAATAASMGESKAQGLGLTNITTWFISDIGVQASPTNWFGGSVTMSGIGNASGTSYMKVSNNYQNGQVSTTSGNTKYDDNCDETSMSAVITNLLGT